MVFPDKIEDIPEKNEVKSVKRGRLFIILLSKYNLELYMTVTELTESTESGVWGGKSISVFCRVELIAHLLLG